MSCEISVVVVVVIVILLVWVVSSGGCQQSQEAMCPRCVNNPGYQKFKEDNPGINDP